MKPWQWKTLSIVLLFVYGTPVPASAEENTWYIHQRINKTTDSYGLADTCHCYSVMDSPVLVSPEPSFLMGHAATYDLAVEKRDRIAEADRNLCAGCQGLAGADSKDDGDGTIGSPVGGVPYITIHKEPDYGDWDHVSVYPRGRRNDSVKSREGERFERPSSGFLPVPNNGRESRQLVMHSGYTTIEIFWLEDADEDVKPFPTRQSGVVFCPETAASEPVYLESTGMMGISTGLLFYRSGTVAVNLLSTFHPGEDPARIAWYTEAMKKLIPEIEPYAKSCSDYSPG